MIRIADFNGDSIDDYIIAEAGWDNRGYSYRPSYQSHLFMSTGNKFKHVEFGILDKAHGVTVGDIENDGDQDFIISYVDRSVIHINDGKGNFKNQGMIQMGYHTSYLELIDFDSDGYLDLFIGTSGCKNASSVLRNNGRGSFSPWDQIKIPLKASQSPQDCLSRKDPWSGDFGMVHHIVEFDDKFLLLTSNNHEGWGFTTLQKNGKNVKIMNSGKFKKENVSDGTFPYKVMVDKDKVVIFDFSFHPYYFEFNHETGELIQQLGEVKSSNEKVKIEEPLKKVVSNKVKKPFKYTSRNFKPQLKLLESQNNVEVCDAISKEFYAGDYYSRTKKNTYFFVSLDSNGKDCHYEWAGNEGNALRRCKQNNETDGKCTIYALGDNIVWGNPKLYKELTGRK